MDIKLSYVPNDWQAKYHASNSRHCCLVGGLGTTSIDTLIYEADFKKYISIRWLIKNKHRPTVLSWTEHGWTKVKASMPYFEGVGKMFEVIFKSGKKIYVGENHKFLTTQGFVRTQDLPYDVIVISPRELPSTVLHDEACVPDEIQTQLNSMDDCWKDLDLYDEQPRNLLEVVQELDLRQQLQFSYDDEHLFSPYSSYRFPRSIQNSFPLKVFSVSKGLGSFLYEESDELVLHGKAIEVLDESSDKSNQAWKDVLSCQSIDLKPIPSYDDTSQSIRWTYQEQSSSSLMKDLKRNQSLLKLVQDILIERKDSQDDPLLPIKTLYQPSNIPLLESSYGDTVVSIEYVGIRAYFDLHVPITNNYVANGVVNHNSGKSTAAVNEHLQLALENPGSLWLVGRKTLPSLKDTILRTFQKEIPKELIKEFNKSHLNMKLLNGSEFIFRPLDDPEKLKSLEISGFIVEEANEIEKEMYDRLKDRVRQKIGGKTPFYRSTIMLNPTDEEHWIPQLFLFQKMPNHGLFQSTTIDNLENLPEDYVDGLKDTYTGDALQRLLYGQFGRIHKGKPVFPMFKTNNHVFDIAYDEKLPLIRGWDFGFNRPVCVWLQICRGQVRVLAEAIGDRIYLKDFVNGREDPFFAGVKRIQEELFGNVFNTMDFCDPRGSDESDKGQSSVAVLNELGIRPAHRRTSIQEGLTVMKDLLEMKDPITKNPNFIVHRRCRRLIEAMRGGYHRDDEGDDPVKDSYYDDVVDATRYATIHICQRIKINRIMNNDNYNKASYSPKTGYRREIVEDQSPPQWWEKLP